MRQAKLRVLHARRSQGYVLVLVLLLISALMIGSVQFMSRTAIGAQISGTTRDNDETALLAENAANLVLGRFMYGADLNGDGIADNKQLRVDANAFNDTPVLPYVFGVAADRAQGLNQTQPTLLQRVADGEAHAVALPGAAQTFTVAPQVLSDSVNQLRVEHLFAAGTPLLVTAGADGVLTLSTQTWSQANVLRRAAVWVELVREPGDEAYVRLYVEATARIGGSRAHIQRFGGFVHTNLLGNLAALTESSMP